VFVVTRTLAALAGLLCILFWVAWLIAWVRRRAWPTEGMWGQHANTPLLVFAVSWGVSELASRLELPHELRCDPQVLTPTAIILVLLVFGVAAAARQQLGRRERPNLGSLLAAVVIIGGVVATARFGLETAPSGNCYSWPTPIVF
jgi:hypothetical protein